MANEKTRMKPACAYARCSTDDQAGSLPAQWSQLEHYAKNEDYEIIERYEDDGVSGTRFQRPGLQALINAAESGADWEYVLVWDRSRLGRPEDPREALAVTYAIESRGKRIVPLHGAVHGDNTLLNTLTEALEFGQAGEESIRRSRDVLRGQRETALRGSIPSGKVPYGYDAMYFLNDSPYRRVRHETDGSKKLLTIDGSEVIETLDKDSRIGKSINETLLLIPGAPRQVEVVQRIYDEYIDGESPRSIAYGLNKDGVRSPRGGNWTRTTIVRILENPAYKGTMTWNAHATGRFHTLGSDGQVIRKSNPQKKWSENEEDARIVRDNAWDGIISQEQWDEAQRRRNEGSEKTAFHGKGRNSNFLASSLMRCVCGSHFSGSGTRNKLDPKRPYEYYRCNRSHEGMGLHCTSKRIRREIVDNYLERRIRELYFEPVSDAGFWKQVGEELDSSLESIAQPGSLETAYTELRSIEARIDRIVEAVADGVLTPDEVDGKLAPLRESKRAQEESIQRVEALGAHTSNLRNLRTRILDECKNRLKRNRDLWPSATPVQRKQIVRAYVDSIMVNQPKSEMVTTFYPLLHGPEFGIPETTWKKSSPQPPLKRL